MADFYAARAGTNAGAPLDGFLTAVHTANFKLGAGTSMFQLELAAVLQKGGPWVADRWERAKLYRAD